MKIVVVGKFHIEGFALHISQTLEKLGHTVLKYEPGVRQDSLGGTFSKRCWQAKNSLYDLTGRIDWFRLRRIRKLVNMFENNGINLTIVCHDYLYPREVEHLKKISKAPIILWFPDSICSFSRHLFLNSKYDAMFFKDPYIVSILRKTVKKNIYYLPECFNPISLSDVELEQEDYAIYECELSTAGNLYSYRTAFFSQLTDYDVKIWGNPAPLWMDVSKIEPFIQGRFVANEEKVKAFRLAKIVINSLHPGEIWGINARAFEVAGAGGFQMIDWRPGLDQLFVDGREIITFRGMKDMKEKIEYFLQRDEERLKIALGGRTRANDEHTYEKRLECMFNTVLNDGNGYPVPENLD